MPRFRYIVRVYYHRDYFIVAPIIDFSGIMIYTHTYVCVYSMRYERRHSNNSFP